MKRYLVHDLQGCNFMDYSHDEPLTALEIRQIRWQDYKDNMQDAETPLKWAQFTLGFIADLWELEFEEVKFNGNDYHQEYWGELQRELV